MDKTEKMVREAAKKFIKSIPYEWGYRLLWKHINASDGSLALAVDRMVDDAINKVGIMKHDSSVLPGATSDPDQGYPGGYVDPNRRSHL
jgi:hypothetical protein